MLSAPYFLFWLSFLSFSLFPLSYEIESLLSHILYHSMTILLCLLCLNHLNSLLLPYIRPLRSSPGLIFTSLQLMPCSLSALLTINSLQAMAVEPKPPHFHLTSGNGVWTQTSSPSPRFKWCPKANTYSADFYPTHVNTSISISHHLTFTLLQLLPLTRYLLASLPLYFICCFRAHIFSVYLYPSFYYCIIAYCPIPHIHLTITNFRTLTVIISSQIKSQK
jgi:hypothetical protein